MEFQVFKTFFRYLSCTILFLSANIQAQCFGDRIQEGYNSKNTDGIRRLFNQADNESDSFLAIYRLYPLTEDETLIADLPATPQSRNAKDYALLSALWSYRINKNRSLMMTLGTRIIRLLNSAERTDAQNPFSLLVVGQSLLFKPAIFGGSADGALRKFRHLKEKLTRENICGVSIWDAEVWIWYAMKKKRDPQAENFKQSLYRRNPPPIYRDFLNNPPD